MNKSSNTRHALIIGGGIAGPVAAMFLQKAGISSVVYEARPDTLATGGGLQIAPNGMHVLKAIGVDKEVAKAGWPASRLCFRNSYGRILSTVVTGDPAVYGSPAITIDRSELHCVLLLEAIARDIPIRFNKRLVAIDDRPGSPVIAHFADGTSAEGDILIGADGIWSTVRCLILPDAPDPVYTGLYGIGGYAPLVNSAALALGEKDTMTMTWGSSGFFGYGQCRHARSNAMLWWSNQASETPPSREELKSDSSPQAQARLRRELLALHKDWHDPIRSLIESTEEVMRTAIYEMPSLPKWHNGRSVLIGDAAHGMATSAGQGASQALEDAMLLARLLRDEPVALHAAFPRFEQQRRPRVEKISAIARRNSDRKKTLGPIAMRVRDFFIAHVMPAIARRSWGAMYAYKLDW